MNPEYESYDPSSPTGQSILNANNADAARTALSLGTLATQNANAVTISGGTVSGATVVAVEPTDEFTANTTLTSNHKVVWAKAIENDVVLTLPETPADGQPYDIKAQTVGNYTVTVQKHAGTSHKIDGADSITVPNGSSRSLVYVGGNDWILR